MNVDFVLNFPSDVGLVKNANAHLILLSNKSPARPNNGRLGMVLGAGKQIRMPVHSIEGGDADDTCSPIFVFQNPIFGTLSERNVDELLCSHLNFNGNGGDEIHLSTRIHLKIFLLKFLGLLFNSILVLSLTTNLQEFRDQPSTIRPSNSNRPYVVCKHSQMLSSEFKIDSIFLLQMQQYDLTCSHLSFTGIDSASPN